MSHSHHHHHDEGCGCGCKSHDHDSCCSHEHKHDSCCGHQDSHDCHQDIAHHLLHVADEAWMEILKDKIKKHILASCDQQLENIASIVSESNKSRWQHKLAIQKAKQEFKDKLEDAFGCSSGSCKS